MPAIQTTRLYQLQPVESRAIGVWHCGQGRKMKLLAVVTPKKATTDQENHLKQQHPVKRVIDTRNNEQLSKEKTDARAH